MRFSNLYNTSPMGSSRRYDSETGRRHRTSENTDSPERSPQSPESSGALQGLNQLQINRPRANTQPNTQRRGLASRISNLFGGGRQPAPEPISQTGETTVRIDRARGPRRERMSAAEIRQHMTNALAQLQQGRSLVAVVGSLPAEAGVNFNGTRTALTNNGRMLVATYGSDVLKAFEDALALPSAARRDDLAAAARAHNRRVDGTYHGQHDPQQAGTSRGESVVRDHMMSALARLRQGEALQEILNSLPPELAGYLSVQRTTLTNSGRDLAASYGVLDEFERALALPSASRRPATSAMVSGLHQAGVYRGAQRNRRSRRVESDARPRARTGSDGAARPPVSTTGRNAASTPASASQTLIGGGFVAASNAFLRPDATMADVAANANIGEAALRAFLTEAGLTNAGLELLHRCDLSTQAAVLWNVQRGLTRRAEANNDAAQPASPARSEDRAAASPQAQPESPRFAGAPDSQWPGWAFDAGTPDQAVTGPSGTLLPVHPSTPSWEVTGSPGPALSADSPLLGSHLSYWPDYSDPHSEEVIGLPVYPQPAHPSTPSWEVTGSPGPALSADSPLLGAHLSHWPDYSDPHGEEVMGLPAYPQPAYPSIPSWEVTGSPGPALSADSSLLGSHFSHWPDYPATPDPDEVVGPPASAQPPALDTTFHSFESLGGSTLPGDLQDDAYSSALAFNNPSAMHDGSSYGYGHGYPSYGASSSNWPPQAAPAHEHGLVLWNLPVGSLPGVTRASFLAQAHADTGYASSQGLNCLLDSLLQLVHGTRRWPNYEPPGLVQEVMALRSRLVMHGEADPHGNIDAEGANLLAATLAANYGVRIQFIEERANRSLTVHPVYGDQGPLIHILHTPGHFRPLWPKN